MLEGYFTGQNGYLPLKMNELMNKFKFKKKKKKLYFIEENRTVVFASKNRTKCD